jgi:DNA repair protein RecN (Recombination protein N)
VELLARRAEIASELGGLEGDAANREELEAAATAALAAYREAAFALSAARAAWGAELASRLQRELADLALKGTRFEVALERTRRGDSPLTVDGVPVDFGAHGLDRVVFLFAPNPGEPLAPLARTASGGELARVSLALQLAARGEEVANAPTLIFDEADVGLGGAQGAALGRKLKRLARGGQILAVTHLPQVASFADRHHRVTKRAKGGRTYAEVTTLDRAERVAEVARMLSGEKVTALSLGHAEEMVAGAEKERR